MSSSNLQKCNCNFIVNEMLTFVQSKLNIMNPDILVRVCSSTFSKDDIAKSKELLRNISAGVSKAKKESKYKDLYDIIETMKSLDSSNAPTFVAKDINKLPIATNANKLLLKENLSLENEIKQLKSNIVTVDKLLWEFAKIANGQTAYVANYDFRANDTDEVSFRQGDIITDVFEAGENWLHGQVLRTARSGLIPANYVTICNSISNPYDTDSES